MATLKSIAYPSLPTSATPVYTVPSSTTGIVKEVVFANVTGSIVKCSMQITKSGGGTATIIPLTKLLPYETMAIACSTFLQAGDIIKGLSDTASSIDMFISYVEV